mmetsp:Transcript_14678/g.61951  ORF Transcript_14678/g.61951 Transcript_14678/m.61951 type:complete len:212 (+) Transcript_14678:551-1186(+)
MRPLMSARATRGCTSTSISDVSMNFPTLISSTTASPSSPPSSVKTNSKSPSLHWRTEFTSSGKSGNDSRLGFCFRLKPSPAKSLSTFAFFFASWSSLKRALSRCSATRVAGHQGRSFSGISRISAMSSSSGAKSRASFTFLASSTSTPSSANSRMRRRVISGSACAATMRSLGVTSLPSSRFSCGSVPITKFRYPPKSAHGLPIRYRSSSL